MHPVSAMLTGLSWIDQLLAMMMNLKTGLQNIQGVESGTLMRMLVEYRRAGELLNVCGVPGAEEVQGSVRDAIERIRIELARRGAYQNEE